MKEIIVKCCAECPFFQCYPSWCNHPDLNTNLFEDAEGGPILPSNCPLLKSKCLITFNDD